MFKRVFRSKVVFAVVMWLKTSLSTAIFIVYHT